MSVAYIGILCVGALCALSASAQAQVVDVWQGGPGVSTYQGQDASHSETHNLQSPDMGVLSSIRIDLVYDESHENWSFTNPVLDSLFQSSFSLTGFNGFPGISEVLNYTEYLGPGLILSPLPLPTIRRRFEFVSSDPNGYDIQGSLGLYQFDFSIQSFAGFGPSSTLAIHPQWTITATFNPVADKLVRVYELPSQQARGGIFEYLFPSFSTVEVPPEIIDMDNPIGEFLQVQQGCTVTRRGYPIPQMVVVGTPIYLGDIVETDQTGSCSMGFIDESEFAITQESTLVIDEFVFDADTTSDTHNLSVLKDVLVFISQNVSRRDADEAPANSTVIGSGGGIRGRYGDQGTFQMAFVRSFVPPPEVFEIALDYALLDPDTSLDLFVDNLLIGSLVRPAGSPDPSGMTHVTYPVDAAELMTIGPSDFRVQFTGPHDTEFLIDNVVGPGFTNPTFDAGPLGWRVEGDGEGSIAAVLFNEPCEGSGIFEIDAFAGDPENSPRRTLRRDYTISGFQGIVSVGEPAGFGGASHVSFHAGRQDGFFPSRVRRLTSYASDIELEDIDSDGYPDLLFLTRPGIGPSPAGYGFGITKISGDGSTPGYTTGPFISIGSSDAIDFAITDINGDAKSDLVYASALGGIRYRSRNPDNSFSVPTNLTDTSFTAHRIVSCDVNADGDRDLFVVDIAGNYKLFVNDGSGSMALASDGVSAGSVSDLVSIDINSDQFDDLVLVYSGTSPGGVTILKSTGNGTFGPEVRYLDGTSLTEMDVTDSDTDGDPDFAVSGPAGIQLLLNDANGVFAIRSVVSDLTSTVLFIDTNLDNSQDIVALNPATGFFEIRLQGCGGAACSADINSDGQLDFFDVSEFLTAYSSMGAAADFNGDGQVNFFDVSAFLSAFTQGCS